MSRTLQPVTGMKDVLATEIGAWQHVERTAAQVSIASFNRPTTLPMAPA